MTARHECDGTKIISDDQCLQIERPADRDEIIVVCMADVSSVRSRRSERDVIVTMRGGHRIELEGVCEDGASLLINACRRAIRRRV